MAVHFSDAGVFFQQSFPQVAVVFLLSCVGGFGVSSVSLELVAVLALVAPPDRYLHAASMLPPPYWASGATPELLANGRGRKKMPGLHAAMRTINYSPGFPGTHRGGDGCRGRHRGTGRAGSRGTSGSRRWACGLAPENIFSLASGSKNFAQSYLKAWVM